MSIQRPNEHNDSKTKTRMKMSVSKISRFPFFSLSFELTVSIDVSVTITDGKRDCLKVNLSYIFKHGQRKTAMVFKRPKRSVSFYHL